MVVIVLIRFNMLVPVLIMKLVNIGQLNRCSRRTAYP